jgi:hypothetical protein
MFRLLHRHACAGNRGPVLRQVVHRFATLATVLAGQRDAEHAADMESRRSNERISTVRDAITSVSDGRASAEPAERITGMTGAHLRAR